MSSRIGIAVLAQVLFAIGTVSAQCPTNYVCGVASTAPQGSCEDASYNLATGNFFADRSTVQATDRYTVSGLPEGTPVTLRARLNWWGNAGPECCGGGCDFYGAFSVLLREGAANTSSVTNCDGSNEGQLEIMISTVAGQPFDVSCEINGYACCTGFEAGMAGARLQFADIPTGAVLTSCHGHVAVAVEGVPTTPGFGIVRVRPNPTRAGFAASVVLPSEATASVALYDVAGRLIASKTLEGIGPGTHTVRLGDSPPLHPGVYMLRLEQGRLVAWRRQIVVR